MQTHICIYRLFPNRISLSTTCQDFLCINTITTSKTNPMGKKRKDHLPHTPAPRPSHHPPSGVRNDSYKPPNPLAHKFAQLENLLAEVLAEQATDEQWREALGEGQRAEFVRTLKELGRGGVLGWVGTGSARAADAPNITAMATKTSISTVAATSLTAPTSNTSWPPPLPPVSSPPLLTQVFTHPSHPTAQLSPLTTDTSTTHYNRLEFLGDSALKYILSLHLFHRYPSSRENVLSSLRSSLESNLNLSTYSIMYNLPRRTLLGEEAIKANFYSNTKFCADVLEAYVGALVIDDPTPAGWQKLTTWIHELVDPKLKIASGEIGDAYELDRRAREKLNLAVAGVKGVKVEYTWEGGGGGNQGGFWYVARLSGYGVEKVELGRGWGSNKGDAMIRAAMRALRNKRVLEEVGRRKDKWLRERGIEKGKRERGKEREAVEKREEEWVYGKFDWGETDGGGGKEGEVEVEGGKEKGREKGKEEEG